MLCRRRGSSVDGWDGLMYPSNRPCRPNRGGQVLRTNRDVARLIDLV